MKRFMLVFTLGPVQSFIMSARKTRDLWAGSFLLSKLMEAAMEGIVDDAFVFPGAREIEADIPDLPNKYITIFDTFEEAQKVARQSEKQIREKWDIIRGDVYLELFERQYKNDEKLLEIWNRQTDPEHLFEIYWVVVPEVEHYRSWVENATLAMDARKRLRDFSPQDEPGEKSTISGEREVLHGEDNTRQGVRNFWHQITLRQSSNDIKKDGSERLDAIDTIKRFAALYSSAFQPKNTKISYPSTSSIATAPFVSKLLELSVANDHLKKWRELTQEDLAVMSPDAIPYLKAKAIRENEWILRRDGDCFFEEVFTPRYLKENYSVATQRVSGYRFVPASYIPNNLVALRKLCNAVGDHPTPYYVLIQMDGDHMGTLVSNSQSKEQHKEISMALSTFARNHTPQIVQKEHPGRLVYAGGDDVLAFSPLDGVLTMIDKLQRQYIKTVKPAVHLDDQEKVTASMGIAIAHHFTPLSIVRRAALDAEQLAKNRYGRNTFVITLLRRSGEQTRVGCRWNYNALKFAPINLLQQFYTYFLEGIISPKSVYVLLDEVPALVGLEAEAQQSEVKRVLTRQLNDSLDNQQLSRLLDNHIEEKERNLLFVTLDQRQTRKYIRETATASLADKIVELAGAMDNVAKQDWKEKRKKNKELENQPLKLSWELHEDSLRYGLVEVLGLLLAMVFLAREGLSE